MTEDFPKLLANDHKGSSHFDGVQAQSQVHALKQAVKSITHEVWLCQSVDALQVRCSITDGIKSCLEPKQLHPSERLERASLLQAALEKLVELKTREEEQDRKLQPVRINLTLFFRPSTNRFPREVCTDVRSRIAVPQ